MKKEKKEIKIPEIEEKVLYAMKKEQILPAEAKKRKAPLGIRIISIIYYIATILYFAIAIVAFIKSAWISELSNLGLLPAMSQQTITTFGIIFALLAALSFFIARGLVRFQMWARIALLSICAINIIGGIFSIIEGNYPSAINLVFNLVIAVYLIFSKKVKAAFSK